MAALNVLVNPFGLYGSGGFHQKIPNFRQDKLELVAQAKPAPDTLVLGSSRVMCISPEQVEGYIGGSVFNFGMVNAKPEDCYSALRLVVEDLGIPIKKIVLGLDHAALNADVPSVAEALNNADFAKYLIHHEGTRNFANSALPMLISMEQTRTSIRMIRQLATGVTDEKARILPNGQVDYIAQNAEIASGDFDLNRLLDKRIRSQPIRGMHMDKFFEPDPLGLAYLGSLLEYCQQNQIQVYAYSTTYHPRQVEVLNSFPNKEVLAEVVDTVGGLLAEYGIEYHDFTNLESFGGSREFFYDGVHMRAENEALLIDHLLGNKEYKP